jgi:hypothetical protein
MDKDLFSPDDFLFQYPKLLLVLSDNQRLVHVPTRI